MYSLKMKGRGKNILVLECTKYVHTYILVHSGPFGQSVKIIRGKCRIELKTNGLKQGCLFGKS
jgi:hypothetical protein